MNWFNRSLFNKLLTSIASGCALIILAATFYFVRVSDGFDSYNRLLAVELTQRQQVGAMLSEFKTQIQEWKNVLLRGAEPEQLERYWNRFVQQEQKVQEIGAVLLKDVTHQEARQLVEK